MSFISKGYLLHRAPFKESSALAHIWTFEQGLVSAVVKSVNAASGSSQLRNAWLQPFQLLSLEFRGQRELKTIYRFEPLNQQYKLAASTLQMALYLNQIVLDMAKVFALEVKLLKIYEQTLEMLSLSAHLETRMLIKGLRYFEMNLLKTLGYGIDWTQDISGLALENQKHYTFEPLVGFRISALQMYDQPGVYLGRYLKNIDQGDWTFDGGLSILRQVHQAQLAALKRLKI